jgi:hypothetical protein
MDKATIIAAVTAVINAQVAEDAILDADAGTLARDALLEVVNGSEKDNPVRDPAVIRVAGAVKKLDGVDSNLYKLMAQAATPEPEAKPAKAAGKKGGKKGGAKKAAPKKAARADGFTLTKVQCAEQKVLPPIGLIRRKGTATWDMYAVVVNFPGEEDHYHTDAEIKEAAPKVKDPTGFLKDCGTEKWTKYGWVTDSRDREITEGEGDDAKTKTIKEWRICADSAFTITEGADLRV